MTIEDFKELVYGRCCEVGTKIGKTKGNRLLKKNSNNEILSLIFCEIRWYLNNCILDGRELVDTFTPEELLNVGFLTQGNNPIDFSKTVNIGDVSWYNENEPCGIIEDVDDIIVYRDTKLTKKEFCKRCDEKEFCKGRKSNCVYGINEVDYDDDFFTEELLTLNIELPKTKRLPSRNELRSLCSLEQQLGYYNSNLCKVFNKKLVLPICQTAILSIEANYLSNIDKMTDEYVFLSLEPDKSRIVYDCRNDILIRCVKTNSKLIDSKSNLEKIQPKVIGPQNKKVSQNDGFPPIRDTNRSKSYNQNQGCLNTIVISLCLFLVFLILI
jgi:hypothetical protein